MSIKVMQDQPVNSDVRQVMDRRKKVLEERQRVLAVLAHIFDIYINVFSIPFGKGAVRKLFLKAGYSAESDAEKGIKKLEEAKASLHEAMMAIEELTLVAERNRRDSEDALYRLRELEQSQQSAESQLAQAKLLASSDIDAFRKVAGVPSESDIRRERFIGFVSGVVGSIVASGLIALGMLLYQRLA